MEFYELAGEIRAFAASAPNFVSALIYRLLSALNDADIATSVKVASLLELELEKKQDGSFRRLYDRVIALRYIQQQPYQRSDSAELYRLQSAVEQIARVIYDNNREFASQFGVFKRHFDDFGAQILDRVAAIESRLDGAAARYDRIEKAQADFVKEVNQRVCDLQYQIDAQQIRYPVYQAQQMQIPFYAEKNDFMVKYESSSYSQVFYDASDNPASDTAATVDQSQALQQMDCFFTQFNSAKGMPEVEEKLAERPKRKREGPKYSLAPAETEASQAKRKSKHTESVHSADAPIYTEIRQRSKKHAQSCMEAPPSGNEHPQPKSHQNGKDKTVSDKRK